MSVICGFPSSECFVRPLDIALPAIKIYPNAIVRFVFAASEREAFAKPLDVRGVFVVRCSGNESWLTIEDTTDFRAGVCIGLVAAAQRPS